MGRTSPLAALTLLAASCATWASTGSVWRGTVRGCPVHVGARPSSDAVGDWAVTLQITTEEAAPCRVVYPERLDAGRLGP